MRGDMVGTVVDAGTSYVIYRHTPQHTALLEWLRFHELDPFLIPAGTAIERDGPGCRIIYRAVQHGPDGRIVWDPAGGAAVHVPAIQQGEGVLPLPTVVTAGDTHDGDEPS